MTTDATWRARQRQLDRIVRQVRRSQREIKRRK